MLQLRLPFAAIVFLSATTVEAQTARELAIIANARREQAAAEAAGRGKPKWLANAPMLKTWLMQKGDSGQLPGQTAEVAQLRVIKIISKDALLVAATGLYVANTGGAVVPFVLGGVDTTDVADDQVVTYPGLFRATGVLKVRDRTYQVVERDRDEETRLAVEEKRQATIRANERDRKSARKREMSKLRKAWAAEKTAKIAADKADRQLAYAKKLLTTDPAKAKARLKEIVNDFPDCPASIEAAAILEKTK